MKFNHLFLTLMISMVLFFQAPNLVAQNDRGPALSNVPALINNLADTKPLKRQIERTYSAEYFPTYSSVVDHVQGMAQLANGNYVFSHSTYPNQKGLAVFARPNADAIYKPFSLNNLKQQSHPSAFQACGNIVAIPNTDEVASVHFFDASDPNNIVELTHLTITYFENSNKPLDVGIDAVGLVYSETAHKHYLTVSKGSESGRSDGPVWLYESNSLPLTDPNCRFTYSGGDRFFRAFTSAAGFNLLYDESGDLYAAAMYRTDPGGAERVKLSKIFIESDTTYAHEVTDILLSESGDPVSPSPGFRWGGGIAINGPNSIEVFASARVVTGGLGANYCVIKVWKGIGVLEDCRKYLDASWLTSHNAFVAPSYGYPAINNQSLDLAGQLEGGARAFTLDTWEKANLNAPSGGPAYNNLKDAMSDGVVYLLNDPRREPSEGGLIPGVNWPTDLDANLPKARLSVWLNSIGAYLLSNPTEVITLILEGDASFGAHLNALGTLSDDMLDLFMNQNDYDNLSNLTLGEMRSSGRRLAVFRAGGTFTFNIAGRRFQFRDRFEKMVENTTSVLPGALDNCDKRAESANLDTPDRLVVFNHLGQPYHELIVRRWLDHCSGMNIPNFLVVNNVTDGSVGVQPKDAVVEFNRRINERIKGGNVRYRIMVAESTWNITQESDDDGATVLTSDNAAEWDFILNSDKSYFIRLKDSNRYLTAPANIFGVCQMKTDTDTDRARWYVEPLPGGVIRLFSQHRYAGTRKAMREVDGGDAIKLSDNIDFVDLNAQKFELVPVKFINATCKPATVVLDETGSAILNPETIKEQVSYSGICEAELFVTVDKNFFSCSDVGTHQVTLNASNGADLSTACSATVTVIDNTQPTLECPVAQIISANSNCAGTVGSWSPLVIADNCSANLTVTQTPTPITALNGHDASKLVTLTANDGHGNSIQCSFSVTLKDNTGPVITCKNATTNLDNSGIAVIGYGLVYVSGSDNCGDVNLESISKTLFRCVDIGPNTVTVTANDGNGNIGTCTAIVTVVDNRAPNVVCNPYTAFLNQAGTVSILPNNVYQSGTDNCGTVNLVSVVPNAFNCSNLGANNVLLTANDGRGNLSTCSATVTIVDDIQPTVICKPYTAYLNQAGAAIITPNDVFQSGADNCSVVNQVSVAPNAFNCSNLGTNTVTLTVNDGNGNTSTCTSTVTVVDNIAPTVQCKPFTAYLDNLGTVSITPGNVFQSGADNCSVVNQVSVEPNTFNCSNLGTNTVLLTINDGKGNLATCHATVTVVDNLNPTVVCKSFTANLNAAGTVNITPADVFQSGADNCGVVNLGAVAPSSFTCAQLGSNQVTLTVNDGHGNGASCNTFVTVKDAIIPTMICKNVTLNLNSSGQATLTVAQVNNGSFDNCTLSNMGLSQTLFTCANAGLNTVTLGGTDQSLNKGQCTATITVLDAILPVAKCKVFSANLNVNGTVTVAPNSIDNGSYDNCTYSITLTPNVFTCANIGLNSVTLRATDASGNSATCSTKVTIKDVTAPTAICKNATIFLNDLGQATLSTSQVNNGSSDACGISSMTLTKTQFNCGDLFTPQTVTMTLKDVNNNQSSCIAQISVKDNLAPTANCTDITVELGPNGTVTVFGADLADDSYDNCSIWIFEPTAKVFTVANLGNNNVNVNVKDGSNNLSTCTAVVTVLPNIGLREEKDPLATGTGVDLALYPNPSSGAVTLSFQLPEGQGFVVRAFDLAGREIYQQEGVGLEGNNTLPLRFEGAAPGIYWIDFQAGGTHAQKRLVVQR